jgi:hypothetical protein
MTWAAMWNSVFFPIDAWAPGSIWDAILDTFDPDEMLLGTNDTSLESKLARRYDPMLSFSFAHLVHSRAPLEGLTANLRTIAAAQAAEVGQRASRIVRLFDVKSGPDSLRIMVAAAAGDIDDDTVKEITSVGAAYGRLELDPVGKTGGPSNGHERRPRPAEPLPLGAQWLGHHVHHGRLHIHTSGFRGCDRRMWRDHRQQRVSYRCWLSHTTARRR